MILSYHNHQFLLMVAELAEKLMMPSDWGRM